MRAAVMEADGSIAVQELPRPVLRAGEALVRVLACGICGSDLMDWYMAAKAPIVPGHEPVGIVEELGEGAGGGLYVGQRVFVHHHVPCEDCDLCRRGRETLCATFKSTALDPGGFSQLVRVPAEIVARDVLPLPNELSDEAATLIEPLACCVRGVRGAAIAPGDVVVVIGLGQMGQLYVRAALAAGAEVVAVDLREERRALAARVGATPSGATAEEVRAALAGRDAHVAVACTGAPPALELAFETVARGGIVQLFAPGGQEQLLAVAVNRIFFDEVTVQGSYSAGPEDTRGALALLASGTVDATGVVTHRFPLDQIAEALKAAKQAENVVKVVVEVAGA